MNEQPTPSPITQTLESINRVVPSDWLPYYFTKPDQTILKTLKEVAQTIPSLEEITLAVLKDECLDIYQKHKNKLLLPIINSLPTLQKNIINEPLFSMHDIFLLGHDTSAPFNTFADKIYIHRRELYPKFDELRQQINIFYYLGYRFEEISESPTLPRTHAYGKLMREFATYAILPTIQEILQLELPIDTFELYELRSGYRELLGIDAAKWATPLPIRTTLEQFVQSQKFRDKNTLKPVEVHFSDNCADPLVFIDPGDLFRMTRNLLRDAVTHGEGEVITPTIHIAEHNGVVEYSIYSPGHLDEATLAIIGLQPYTTQDHGDRPREYGKVGARKLLTALWNAVGASPTTIEVKRNNTRHRYRKRRQIYAQS